MQTASRNDLLREVAPYQGNRKLLVKYQNTNDIIKALQNAHIKNAADYDKICGKFWNGKKKALYKRLFNFCKKNIAYEIETDQNQTIKSCAAILAQKKGDCKHYASFINGVISACNRRYNLGIDNCFRFSGYKAGATEPQHVFAVVKDGDEEIWIDPVLENFNEHKPFTFHKDKKANTMLTSLSGLPEYGEIGKHGNGLRKWRKLKDKAGKFVKKFAGAPVRNAFLALVKLNFKQLAIKMAKMWSTPTGKKKLVNLWVDKFGGKESALKNSINAGIKHYRQRHKTKMSLIAGMEYDQKVLDQHYAEVGFVVAAGTSSLIATATPIIVAVLGLLKGAGGASGGGASGGGDATVTEAPVMTEAEATETEDAVNGCIGAVVRKHVKKAKVKAHTSLAKGLVNKLKKELSIPANKTAVQTLKAAAIKKLNPEQQTAVKDLSKNLTALKELVPTTVSDKQRNPSGWTAANEIAYKFWLFGHSGTRQDYLFWLRSQPAPQNGNDRPGANPTGWTAQDEQDYKFWLMGHSGTRQDYLFWTAQSQKIRNNVPGANSLSANEQQAYTYWLNTGHTGGYDDYLTWKQQQAAAAQSAQQALNQGASPLMSYAAKQAQGENEAAPADEKEAMTDKATQDDAIEAEASGGMSNGKMLLIGGGALAAIYFFSKKGKH